MKELATAREKERVRVERSRAIKRLWGAAIDEIEFRHPDPGVRVKVDTNGHRLLEGYGSGEVRGRWSGCARTTRTWVTRTRSIGCSSPRRARWRTRSA